MVVVVDHVVGVHRVVTPSSSLIVVAAFGLLLLLLRRRWREDGLAERDGDLA